MYLNTFRYISPLRLNQNKETYLQRGIGEFNHRKHPVLQADSVPGQRISTKDTLLMNFCIGHNALIFIQTEGFGYGGEIGMTDGGGLGQGWFKGYGIGINLWDDDEQCYHYP